MSCEGDSFKSLSTYIKIQNCYIHIAYTTLNTFYLIAIKKNGSLYVEKLTNSNDVDSPKGILNWFKR